MRSSHANIVLVVLFAMLLLTPTAAKMLGYEPFSRLNEKRVLAPKPTRWLGSAQGETTSKSLLAAAQEWDKYYTDHFGLRKLLIGTYRLFTVHVRRGHPDVQDPKLNSHSKLNCITACIQATKAGADEALMLDPLCAKLAPSDIRKMGLELMEATKEYLPQF